MIHSTTESTINTVTTIYKDGTYTVYGSNLETLDALIARTDPGREIQDQILGVHTVDTSIPLNPQPD